MIHKYLDLSTAYLTAEQGTGNFPDEVGYSIEYEYGFILFLYQVYTFEYDKLPGNLSRIVRYAKSHDCHAIRFDCDGDEAPDDADFERYEW